MNTLFLIGNGFDLNCGMRTAYKDIYPSYIAEHSSSNVISKFKQDISSNIETWSDFESAMARYAGNYDNENDFLECIYDFSAFATDYLTKQELKFKKYLQSNKFMSSFSSEMYNSLRGFYLDCTHNVINIMNDRLAGDISHINVVSFNYTTIFDMIFQDVYSNMRLPSVPVLYIHGILGDDPIFGIDNESQLNVSYPITNNLRQSFVKPYFNGRYDKQRIKDFQNLISSADTICTYGLSLGESDLSWRNAIISRLKECSNTHLFYYDYQYLYADYKVLAQKMTIEESAKQKLLLSWNIEATDDLLERIHIPIRKNIFNFSPFFKLMPDNL